MNIKAPKITEPCITASFIMNNLTENQRLIIKRKANLLRYIEENKKEVGTKKALQKFAELNNVDFKTIDNEYYKIVK